MDSMLGPVNGSSLPPPATLAVECVGTAVHAGLSRTVCNLESHIQVNSPSSFLDAWGSLSPYLPMAAFGLGIIVLAAAGVSYVFARMYAGPRKRARTETPADHGRSCMIGPFSRFTQDHRPSPAWVVPLVILIRLASDLPLLWMFYSLQFPAQGGGGVVDAGVNLFLFAVFGSLHSLLARDFAKERLARLAGTYLVRPVYVVVNGIAFAFVLYLWRPLGGELWHASGPSYWALTALYVSAVVGLLYTASFFDYAEFIGIRELLHAVRGRPHRPPVFACKGPYAHCRHPMYALLLIALWVGPHMTFGRLEFALVGSLYLLLGTFLEERNLRKELGAAYDRYREHVPMWIPRLTPWKQE